MYKHHSIVNTGNFNADFKLLTHNRYSVLNGHFVRQIHPSSLYQMRRHFREIFVQAFFSGYFINLLKLCSAKQISPYAWYISFSRES